MSDIEDEDCLEFFKKYEKKLIKLKDQLIEVGFFEDYDTILSCTKEQLAEYGLKTFQQNIVWKCIDQEQRDYKLNNRSVQQETTFDWQLTLGKNPYTIKNLTSKTTILQLRKAIAFACRGDESTWEDFKVTSISSPNLDDNKTLSSYEIIDSTSIGTELKVLFQLDGGTQTNTKSIWNHTKNRRLRKKKYPFLNIVTAVCDVMQCDKEECNRMKCGHNIAPMTCFSLIKRLIEKDFKTYKMRCPVVTNNNYKNPKYCNEVWSWTLIRAVADLDDEEFEKAMNIIRKRDSENNKEVKKCPHESCQKLCTKPKKVGIFRVACKCRKGDWCWQCGKFWKAEGFAICGNQDCSTWYKQLALLKSDQCWDKNNKDNSYYEYKDKPVPKIRACPNCFTLIYHKKACKHMKCKFCTTSKDDEFEFCFLCLDIKKNGKWEKCISSDYKKFCSIAPIQLLGGSGLDYPEPTLKI